MSVSVQLVGSGVSSGVVVAPVAVMGTPVTTLPEVTAKGDPDFELDRAKRALEDVAAGLEERRDRAEGTAAEVLEAQVMMARDPGLAMIVEQQCKDGGPAVHAIDAAIRGFQDQLRALGGYMAERAADLDDLRNRALARLLHLPVPGIPERDHPFVLVADDLAPADTVDLDPHKVLGLITERGGPTSHTAIIAKSLGLPAIVSCRGALALEDGTTVVLDGSTGAVTVDPTPEQVAEAEERIARRAEMLVATSGPGRTADGHAVSLLLNLGSVEAAQDNDVDAEGVGLFRTEFLFLDRLAEPTIEEQVASYRNLFQAFAGDKVVVRTLDVGADKPLPFIDPGPGDNPALGQRGWRLRDRQPEIVDRQLEAIATAAKDAPCDVWVMAPMVSTVAEAAAFVDLAHDLGLSKAGVMVEVPSLALAADRLMEVVDFVSIGTNDLSQYTFAANRLVGELGELLDPWQPPLLSLVARVATAGATTGTPVGICGVAASDPQLAVVLTGFGCTSLSMAGSALPEVRGALAQVDLATCERAAAAALDAPDPDAARHAVSDILGGVVVA